MLRLAHRILSQKRLPNVYQQNMWKPARDLFVLAKEGLCRGCPVIIADNVSDYLNTLRQVGDSQLFADFPPMPPPFNSFFIECSDPPIHYYGAGKTENNRDKGYIQQSVFVLVNDHVDDVQLTKHCSAEIIEKTRWSLTGTRFVNSLKVGPLPISMDYVLLDAEGRFLVGGMRPLIRIGQDGSNDPGMATFLMTMAFMQCKNVKRLDATASEGPTPKWCRRQRLPELKYHTLQIDGSTSSRPGDRVTEGDRSGSVVQLLRRPDKGRNVRVRIPPDPLDIH